MRRVTIYTTPICPYCARAKSLLRKKGAEIDEIDVFMDCEARAKMAAKSGGRHTVPQIFVDGEHLGGCDDLYALDQSGRLDSLLSG